MVESNNSINSIQILRGVASLAVVAFHCRWFLNGAYAEKSLGHILFDYGSFGVDMFFIISGFIITLATRKGETIAQFAIKRFFRIYPLYIFCLILFLIFINEKYSMSDYIHALTITPLDQSSLAPYYGYNILAVSWTLSYEILFYVIFGISMVLSQKYRALICSIIITLLWLSSYHFTGSLTIDPVYTPTINLPINYVSNPITLNFILGMLSYYIYSLFNIKNENLIFLLKAVSLFAISLCFLGIASRGMHHGIMMWGGMAFFIVTLLVILEKHGINFYFKKPVYIGTISYSLYLVHPVILQFFRLESMQFFNSTGFVKFFCMVLFSISFAMITHRFIELPSQTIARRICKKIDK
nr:acyltransferase [Mixta theicola]